MIYRRHANNLTNDQRAHEEYDFRSDQTADGSTPPNEVTSRVNVPNACQRDNARP